MKTIQELVDDKIKCFDLNNFKVTSSSRSTSVPQILEAQLDNEITLPLIPISAELTNQMMKLSSNAPVVVITQSSSGLVEEHIFASKAALAQSTQFFHNHSFDIKSIFNTTTTATTTSTIPPSTLTSTSTTTTITSAAITNLLLLPDTPLTSGEISHSNNNNATSNRCDIEIGLHMGPFYYDHKSSDDICSACGTVAHNLKTSINTISNTTVAPSFQPPMNGPTIANAANMHSAYDTVAFSGNVIGCSSNNRSQRAPTTAICHGSTVTIHPSIIPADDLRSLSLKRGKKRKGKEFKLMMDDDGSGAMCGTGGGYGSDDEFGTAGTSGMKRICNAGNSSLFGHMDSDDGFFGVECGVKVASGHTVADSETGTLLNTNATVNDLMQLSTCPSFTASATSSHRKTIKLITPGNSSMRAELLKQKHLRQRGPPLLGQLETVIIEPPISGNALSGNHESCERHVGDDNNSDADSVEKRQAIETSILTRLIPSPKVAEAGVGSTSIYDPLKYFEDFIDHFNATDKPIFVEVIDAIENEFVKRGIGVTVITPHADFKEVLKHLNYNRLYPFIPQIRYRLTGQAPIRVSAIERTLLLEQYRVTIFNWPLIVKGHNRKSVVNVPVLFNFLCDLNKFTVHLNNPDFARDNLMVNRKKLHSIVHEILYPAVESGLIPKITSKKV